jgi:hypothetical protein
MLMELKEKPDAAQADMLLVVRYAALLRAKATLLELAVLARNVSEAEDYCGATLAVVHEAFEPETALANA